MTVDINDFKLETECVYKDERYSVRDNGSVLRSSQSGKRSRPTDNLWTFGKPNNKTGYLEIASVRIHRIVATAFHGEPPTNEHVVDHIDTNKWNNRPENLRWVTKLENVLLNPITLKRIELACGCTIEEFLANPSKFRDKFQEPNYQWMCTVSIQEAQVSKERLLAWAKSDKLPSGSTLGEWIYNRNMPNMSVEKISEFTTSLTANAVQKDWKTPSKFPFCPLESTDNPIATYVSRLNVGETFAQNQYANSIIVDFVISKDGNSFWVICKGNSTVKPWSLAQVTYENNLFVHTNLGSFFKEDGVRKQFTLAQGLEWTGGETMDDLT
jgi:hypothetical protein